MPAIDRHIVPEYWTRIRMKKTEKRASRLNENLNIYSIVTIAALDAAG